MLPTTQMAINKLYNENLKQFPHEVLYDTILNTIAIGPTTNQTASTFAIKMKNNWALIGARMVIYKKKSNAKKKTLSRSNQKIKCFCQQKIEQKIH